MQGLIQPVTELLFSPFYRCANRLSDSRSQEWNALSGRHLGLKGMVYVLTPGAAGPGKRC